MEDWQNSSLEEKVDLETLVLYPSEPYINEGIEEEIFRIKDEQLENEISNDFSETSIPNHKYEKSPIEFSTNNKAPKFRDFFCFQCSLQFSGTSVYELHQSLVHEIKGQLIAELFFFVINFPKNLRKNLTNLCPSI